MCVKKDNCCSLLCMRTKVKYYIYLIFEVSQITCMGLLLFVRAVREPPLRRTTHRDNFIKYGLRRRRGPGMVLG